ncbi:MAG TPA: ATP-dependent 6-phosphofructokinase, partial [Candidatus Thermoplasmatota archaeon]|nr:ATP-dependent 6-phosphofructokinase [Candidatus Thermoplasmatota archaeon]
AVLTRDCAGVNAALRAVVRTACQHNIEVLGVLRGYDGLIDGHFLPLSPRSVSGIINLGGTVLKTSRSARFLTAAGQQQGVENIKRHGIEGLIVIGGDGSLRGAHVLAMKAKIPVIGIPATIDNDITGIDQSIGADTAVNVALDALDKIRDTATSLERIFIVEVMGRESGSIAMQVALAGGCEEVLLPERASNIERMCQEIEMGNKKGKVSWIIIVAEGRAHAQDIASLITNKTGFETRVVVLGHVQRGGRPTAIDRILAARLGNYAVEELRKGRTDVCVGLRHDAFVLVPLKIAMKPKKMNVTGSYRLLKILSA